MLCSYFFQWRLFNKCWKNMCLFFPPFVYLYQSLSEIWLVLAHSSLSLVGCHDVPAFKSLQHETQCITFLSFTTSLYDIMENHFPRKASFLQLHMRAALEDLGISISIPDILAGASLREAFLEVVKLHNRYRRHNLEKKRSVAFVCR